MECDWCEDDATRVDFRELDGINTKVLCCDRCFLKDTNWLLKHSSKFKNKLVKTKTKDDVLVVLKLTRLEVQTLKLAMDVLIDKQQDNINHTKLLNKLNGIREYRIRNIKVK